MSTNRTVMDDKLSAKINEWIEWNKVSLQSYKIISLNKDLT